MSLVRIRRSLPEDLPATLALLREAGLPTEGIEESFSRFLVADEDGRVVAAAGLEIEETSALLRSVAVAPGSRGKGLGIEIVRQALRLAQICGATTAYLLTTDAGPFFMKLGFKPAFRAEIDGAFPDSMEARSRGCCRSAEAMALRDLTGVLEPYRTR